MVESASGRERQAYQPVFAPLLADCETFASVPESREALGESIVHQFYELSHPAWKRIAFRKLLTTAAIDYTLVPDDTTSTNPGVRLIPDHSRSTGAFQIINDLDHDPQETGFTLYDRHLLQLQLNRAALTSVDPEGTYARLLMLNDEIMNLDIHQRPSSGRVPMRFTLYRLGSETSHRPATDIMSREELERLRTKHQTRLAVLMSDDVNIRKRIPYNGKGALAYTKIKFAEYTRDLLDRKRILPPVGDIIDLLQAGYNEVELAAEFGVSQQSISLSLRRDSSEYAPSTRSHLERIRRVSDRELLILSENSSIRALSRYLETPYDTLLGRLRQIRNEKTEHDITGKILHMINSSRVFPPSIIATVHTSLSDAFRLRRSGKTDEDILEDVSVYVKQQEPRTTSVPKPPLLVLRSALITFADRERTALESYLGIHNGIPAPLSHIREVLGVSQENFRGLLMTLQNRIEHIAKRDHMQE